MSDGRYQKQASSLLLVISLSPLFYLNLKRVPRLFDVFDDQNLHQSPSTLDRQEANHGEAQQDPNEQGPREIVRREG